MACIICPLKARIYQHCFLFTYIVIATQLLCLIYKGSEGEDMEFQDYATGIKNFLHSKCTYTVLWCEIQKHHAYDFMSQGHAQNVDICSKCRNVRI